MYQVTYRRFIINAKRSYFGVNELKYLGYHITCDVIQSISKKLEAMQNINPPKTFKQLRSFIGMINYYREMWRSHSELIAPML